MEWLEKRRLENRDVYVPLDNDPDCSSIHVKGMLGRFIKNKELIISSEETVNADKIEIK